MSDTQHSIGKLLPPKQRRDAIHVAVAPVEAEEPLHPGQHVGLGPDGRASAHVKDKIGVVDPFLEHRVEYGERFFIFLYPNTVTGMVHHWSHPAFDGLSEAKPAVTEEKREAEKWLREFADRWDFYYDQMIDEATRNEGIIVRQGSDLHGARELNGEDVEFWKHIETLTGRTFDQSHREAVCWSCSC